MDSRTLLEAKSQLRGPLWVFLRNRLEKVRSELLDDASEIVPTNLADTVRRDRMLAKAAVYKELLNETQGWVEEAYLAALKQENQ